MRRSMPKEPSREMAPEVPRDEGQTRQATRSSALEWLKRWKFVLSIVVPVFGFAAYLIGVHIQTLKDQIAFYQNTQGSSKVEPRALATSGVVADRLSDLLNEIGYPKLQDPAHPNQADIHQLAEFYGLTKVTSPNAHLRFAYGDTLWWHGRGLTKEQLDMEFESRQLALLRAEKVGTRFESQGELSVAALAIQRRIQGGIRSPSKGP